MKPGNKEREKQLADHIISYKFYLHFKINHHMCFILRKVNDFRQALPEIKHSQNIDAYISTSPVV